VVDTGSGSGSGRGARITAFGEEVVRRYRNMERASRRAVDREMAALREADTGASRGAGRQRSG
jgi:molybdenum-dependent DNA-binding transcriptional regulator ModE